MATSHTVKKSVKQYVVDTTFCDEVLRACDDWSEKTEYIEHVLDTPNNSLARAGWWLILRNKGDESTWTLKMVNQSDRSECICWEEITDKRSILDRIHPLLLAEYGEIYADESIDGLSSLLCFRKGYHPFLHAAASYDTCSFTHNTNHSIELNFSTGVIMRPSLGERYVVGLLMDHDDSTSVDELKYIMNIQDSICMDYVEATHLCLQHPTTARSIKLDCSTRNHIHWPSDDDFICFAQFCGGGWLKCLFESMHP